MELYQKVALQKKIFKGLAIVGLVAVTPPVCIMGLLAMKNGASSILFLFHLITLSLIPLSFVPMVISKKYYYVPLCAIGLYGVAAVLYWR